MNYPVWDVTFGAGLLIALVSILHVFVSHFAVGGGLFLVLTERRALRQGDSQVLGWLRTHTKFFVLVTVVYGAISGVGIWFTIALIHPSATSSLIHAYVWGWAIEWVFFFLEITAALFYLYGWDKLEPRLHLWYGWIYFICAFASLIIINGIITFMLTSGKWIQTHEFWTGFFNPTYFPSAAVRTAIALALAGMYALVTASRVKDSALKARLIKWSARWTVPSMAVLPALIWWYIRDIPSELWENAKGAMPTASHYAAQAQALAAVTFVLVLVTLISPKRLHLAYSLVIMLAALGTMGSFEFVREAIRKPYVIANYMYDNSLYCTPSATDGGFSVEAMDQKGVLNTARWVRHPDGVEAGREIFRVECQSCHTVDAYRGVRRFLVVRQWDKGQLSAMLGVLDMMHNGVMPPFAGIDGEREALAEYLATLYPVAPAPVEGAQLFEQNCVVCHQSAPDDPAIATIRSLDAQTAAEKLKDLPGLFVRMPDLKLNDQQRTALVHWIQSGKPLERAAVVAAERR
ncbi:MAG TPA: c-type cytochrome [Bryobacteraceae bacterium]|nr:c-type cytochrome [Bryobacteraceae bacterium]